MKRLAASLVVLAAAAALAGPPERGGPPPPGTAQEGPRGERFQARMRQLRAVGIGDALDLDTAEVIRLDGVMKGFDERRRPMQKQLHEAMQLLRRAADGDAQALPQVDTATMRILDARAQMAQIDREMFNALAQGRSAQQRAKLALFLAHFQEEIRALRPGRRPGGPPGHGEDDER